jgi:hypothetical protein
VSDGAGSPIFMSLVGAAKGGYGDDRLASELNGRRSDIGIPPLRLQDKHYGTDSGLAGSGHCVAGDAIIVADYPTQDLAPLNWAALMCASMRDRGLLCQALVVTGGIIVVDVCLQDRPQMRLAANQDVVKALLPDGSIMVPHFERAFFFRSLRLVSSLGSFRINKRSYSG